MTYKKALHLFQLLPSCFYSEIDGNPVVCCNRPKNEWYHFGGAHFVCEVTKNEEYIVNNLQQYSTNITLFGHQFY